MTERSLITQFPTKRSFRSRGCEPRIITYLLCCILSSRCLDPRFQSSSPEKRSNTSAILAHDISRSRLMTNFDKFKRPSAADRYRFLDGTAPGRRFLDIIALSRKPSWWRAPPRFPYLSCLPLCSQKGLVKQPGC